MRFIQHSALLSAGFHTLATGSGSTTNLVSPRECEFSRFSGVICPVSVGPSSERLELKFDFRSPISFVYSPKACPVGMKTRCYSQASSVPIEGIEIEGCRMPEIKLNLVTIDKHTDVSSVTDVGLRRAITRYRDVHGMIGAGPESQFMAGRIIEIFETGQVPRFNEIKTYPSTNTVSVDSSSGGWLVSGEMTVNGNIALPQLGTKILIDPGAHEIIIPMRYRESILRHGGADIQSFGKRHIWVKNCKISEVPRFAFTFNEGSIVVKIKRIQLLFFERQVIKNCTLDGIVFSSDIDHIIVGRALVRSVAKIILDGVDSKIGFVPRGAFSRKLGQIIVNPPRVPLFGWLHVAELKRAISISGTTAELIDEAFILFDHDFVYEGEGRFCRLLINPMFPDIDHHLGSSGTIYYAETGTPGSVHFSTEPLTGTLTWEIVREPKGVITSLFVEKLSYMDHYPYAKICYNQILGVHPDKHYPESDPEITDSET
jgi:hypothetical protein